MDYRKRFAVEPGSRVKLKAIDPAFHGKHADEASAKADLAREVSRLTALQYRLYAEKKHACSSCSRASTPPARTAPSGTC